MLDNLAMRNEEKIFYVLKLKPAASLLHQVEKGEIFTMHATCSLQYKTRFGRRFSFEYCSHICPGNRLSLFKQYSLTELNFGCSVKKIFFLQLNLAVTSSNQASGWTVHSNNNVIDGFHYTWCFSVHNEGNWLSLFTSNWLSQW